LLALKKKTKPNTTHLLQPEQRGPGKPNIPLRLWIVPLPWSRCSMGQWINKARISIANGFTKHENRESVTQCQNYILWKLFKITTNRNS